MSNYQLRMSTLTFTLFLATVCLEQYIEFITLQLEYHSLFRTSLSFSNISLYFKYLSPFWTSLPISNITPYFEHHSLSRASLSISNITLHFEHLSLFQTSLSISSITLYFEHLSPSSISLPRIFRRSLYHLSISNILNIFYFSILISYRT